MATSQDESGGPAPVDDRTSVLLGRIRAGDRAAREILFARYLPVLRRWAHLRLPQSARDLRDTDDLVQDTMLRAFRRLEAFEHRGEGAFLAYLRQILLNAIREDLRRLRTRPGHDPLPDDVRASNPSPLDDAIGRDRLARFERALARLPDEQREAIVLRVEFGFSHLQVAEAMGKSSADAARMTVARALVAIAQAMHEA